MSEERNPRHGEPGHLRHDTACAGCAAEALGIRAEAKVSEKRKHTPGPWSWDMRARNSPRLAGRDDETIFRLHDDDCPESDDVDVVAAAPAMLAMLREVE